MKKILVFLFSLLIFSYSFSWVKVPKKDEFGDKTQEYIYGQKFKDGKIVIYWDNITFSKSCSITLNNHYFSKGNYKMKFKIKDALGEDIIKEIDVYVDKGKIYATGMDSFKIINAFKDNDVVKFSFEGKNFRINQGNFNEIYDDNF